MLGLTGISNTQETVQITITGVPGVLPSPFISDLEDDIVTGRYQVQFTYIPSGMDLSASLVEVVFHARLFRNRELLIDEYSLPAFFEPGTHVLSPVFDRIEFESTFEDVISGLRTTLQRQIIQTGALPEGDYRLVLEVEVLSGQMVNVIPAIVHFSVTYPPPPQLMTPGNNTNVVMSIPVFSWTPVFTPKVTALEYEFLLVQMFDGQGPDDAVDANRPHHEQTLMDATTLIYTPDLFPLESGRTYAWMVRAFGAGEEIPIRNDGESEIFTFTFDDSPVSPEDIANLQQIPLVPGLARLVNLENLEVDDAGLFYELNGRAEVEFTMDYLEAPVRAGVSVHGLTIQRTGLDNPVVTGGSVSIYVEQIADVILGESQWITLRDFQYRFGVGITGTARFQHELFGILSTDGELSLTQSGLQGNLRVEGKDLLEFEHELFRVSVNRIVAIFPQLDIYADASMDVFGRPSPCELTGMDLTRENITASWICDQFNPISLTGDSELFVFSLTRTSGSVSINTKDRSMEFSANVRGEAQFDFMNSPPCGVRIKGTFGHDTAPKFTMLGNTCTMPEPMIDLGFVRLGLHNIELESFGYDPISEQWDFVVPFDASVYFPLFDDWAFEHNQPFRLTRNGIDIPEIAIDTNLPSYDHDILRVELQSLVLDSFRFPWFDWDPADPGPWNLEFEAKASIGESAALPLCLRNAVLSIENGRVTNGSLSAGLKLSPLDRCRVPLFAGHNIVITSIGGSFFSQYHYDRQNPFTTTADFFMESRYEAGDPLLCRDDEAAQHTTANVTFSSGKLVGTISVDDTGCRIPIGMMEAVLDNVELSLFGDDGVQNAHLSSQATLILSQDDAIQGSFVYDIRRQRFLELDFSITDPFRWEIPNEQDPVLAFLINKASLSLDGLFVDGRQEVDVSGHRFGVTFDRILVDLYDWNIRSGEIFFDEHFALAVSFDEGLSSPKFTAVRLAEDQAQIPLPTYGLYMELGADVVVDSMGIRTTGTASATVSIGDFSYEHLSITFTDDFALRFKPFGVAKGQANFYFGDSRVAYFDAAGFTPLLSGFANEILPEKLPLPTTNVAYLLLRDANGDLVVDFTEPEPGIIGLSTRPYTPLQLVLPILDPKNPPVVDGVEFEDFTITATPGNFRVETGQAWVTLPEDDVISGLLEQLGIPFDLSEIRYGYTELMSDAGDYLQLAGNLKLFEHTVVADDNMLLKISGSGLVTAEFDFPDLDSSIPMLPNTDQLQLGLTSMSGSLILPVLGGGGISYQIDIEADLLLGSGEESKALSSFGMRLQPGFLSFSAFSSIELEEPLRVGLAGFSMNLNAVTSIPVFEYNSVDGWNFLFSLDADFEFTLPGYDPFELPMNGLQLSRSGFTIPPQEINNSTLHGYELPSFTLAGFTFQPLAMRTLEPVTFNWFERELSPIQPYFDFEVRLPEIGNEDLQAPEGFTFTNVTYQDGFLAGSMEPFEPIGGIVIPAGPPGLNPPSLRVNRINGILGSLERAGEMVQNVEITLEGTVERIPFFEQEDAECDMDVLFALTLERGVGFRGSVQNLVPCGSLDLGPISLSAGSGSLNFSFEDDQQQVVFDGTLRAALEGPQGPFTAEGSVELDLIAGRILSGQVAINSPFNLSFPVRANTPFMEFQVNSARIDRDGFMLDATGLLKAGQVDVDVVFDQLTLAMPEFSIVSGSAQISAGIGLNIGFVPLSASITGAGDQEPPPGEGLLISAESTVILDADGLKYAGQAGAALRLGDQEFANLRTVFEEDFTFSLTSPAVKSGRALVYLDLDGPADDWLVAFDSNGFRFGGGLMALIPDTLGLPSKNIAYAVIRDENGNMLLNLEEAADGGYLLQTGANPLPVYIPALQAADGSVPTLEAHFNLLTDALFVPRGGSLSVSTSLDLEPWLGAPVSIDSIGVSADGDLLLTTRLSVTLPEVFGGQKAEALTTIGPDGFREAVITAGTYVSTYDPGLDHLIQRDIAAMLSGDDPQSEFIVGLYGARLTFNSPAALELAGSISTNLFQQEHDQNFGLFFTVGHGPAGWDFNVETQGTVPEVKLGRALLTFDEHDPFDFEISNDEFLVTVNGTVSFEEMIGEALSFSVADLQFGARNLQTTPQLVLQLGAATANLPDQNFDFFSGAITGSIVSPAITFSGRTFSASVLSGNLTFLDNSMDYSNLYVDTQGNFSIGSVDVGVDGINILQEYLVLKSLGFSLDEATGLGVSGTMGFMVPDPIGISGELFLEGGRDAQKQAWFNTRFDLDSGFDPEEEYTVNLGPYVAVTLADQLIRIDPFNLGQTEIAVAARVAIMGEDRVLFGEPGSLADNPGISVRLGRTPLVMYNATGNVAFSFKHSFFDIDIAGDVVSSNDEAFIITLNGQAGINLPGVGSKVGFGGMTITKDGLVDIGNFTGTVKFDLFDIFTLEMSPFIRKSDQNGFMIPISAGFDAGPEDLRGGDEVAVQEIEVVEFLCFGPCTKFQPQGGAASAGNSGSDGPALYMELGGSGNAGNGTFGGGVHEIQFYRTRGGDIRFFMDRFQVGLGDMFQASASLLYENVGGAQSLLAVGTGSFDVAGVRAGAMLAGSFSNRNGDLSFGVFAGVRADVVSFEIIPGILAISGFGGGFFYKPQNSHLEVVLDAVDVFRSAPPTDIVRPPFELPANGGIDFAVMLLTEMDLVGAGDLNVLSGSMFMMITNQSFHIDADGVIMGMDGENNSLLAGAGLAASFSRTDSGDITIRASLQAQLRMSTVMSAGTTGSGIQFFMEKSGNNIFWGIVGEVTVDLYQNIINGRARLLASNDGFLLQAGLSLDLDPPIIKVDGFVDGGIWCFTYTEAKIPFGAYLEGGGKITAVFSVDATFRTVFVRRYERYKLFGIGTGCVGAGQYSACLTGWFQLETDPLKVDGGLDPGDREKIFDEVEAQMKEFEDMLAGALDKLGVDLEVPPYSGLSDEVVAEAGFNFRMLSHEQRMSWHDNMIRNEEVSGHSAPPVLKDIPIAEGIELIRYKNQLHPGFAAWLEEAEQNKDELINWYREIANNTADRIRQSNIIAKEYELAAAEAMNEVMDAISQSPIISMEFDGNMSRDNLPEFEIDQTTAESHSRTIDDLAASIEQLDEQVRMVVEDIEKNLVHMNRMLNAINVWRPVDVITGPSGFQSVVYAPEEKEPAIHEVLEMSGYALQAVDNYYSLNADHYWRKINEAALIKNLFDRRTQELNEAVEEIYGRLSGRPSLNEAAMAGRRVWFVHTLKDSPTNIHFPTLTELDAHTEAHKAMYAYAKRNIGPLKGDISQLWINLRKLGSQEFMNHTAAFLANDFIEGYLKSRNAVLDVMEVHTGLLEDFYDLKARILGTLYHIIDNYVEVRMQVDVQEPDNLLSDYHNRRQEILQLLEPPVLSSITVDTEYMEPHYFGRAEILWDAQHPVGIAETSIRIDRGDLQGAGRDGYVSIGNVSSYSYTAFKHEYDENNILSDAIGNTASVNVALRLRGKGGVVSRRQAAFNMQLATGGYSTPPGQPLLPPVTSPPDGILVDMDHFYNQGVMEWTEMSEDRFGRNSFREHESMAYWTSQPEYINLRVLAREESSIHKYEYAVGSSPGAADIIEWTDLVGVKTNVVEQFMEDSRSRSIVYTEAMKGRTRILNMIPGIRYYVSARVWNISDQYIQTSLENPVVYDNVPPTPPRRGVRKFPPGYSETGVRLISKPWLHSVDPVAFTSDVPNYSLTESEQRERINWTSIRPSLGTVGWEASLDDQSGIWRYEYLVTPERVVTESDFDEGVFTTQNTAVLITSGEGAHQNLAFHFMDEMFVHVRAVNNAGLASEIHRIGPLIAEDYTRPTRPVVVGKVSASEIRIYFRERSYDPESGMKGQQYSIGRSPGESDVRPWPEDDVMDFTNMSIFQREDSNTPYITIPVGDLPFRTELYFNVRGVNGMNLKSNLASTGPYVRQMVQMREPIITLDSRFGDFIEVKVEDFLREDMLKDIARVEARVRYIDGGRTTTIHDWHTIAGGDRYGVNTTTVTSEFFIGHDREMENVSVDIRITDDNGHTTVVSETYTSRSLRDLGTAPKLDGTTIITDPTLPSDPTKISGPTLPKFP